MTSSPLGGPCEKKSLCNYVGQQFWFQKCFRWRVSASKCWPPTTCCEGIKNGCLKHIETHWNNDCPGTRGHFQKISVTQRNRLCEARDFLEWEEAKNWLSDLWTVFVRASGLEISLDISTGLHVQCSLRCVKTPRLGSIISEICDSCASACSQITCVCMRGREPLQQTVNYDW